jgi:predicted RNase H-like nuclease (RuvC/YqgF family)
MPRITQTPQQVFFEIVLNQANRRFTPRFFENLGKSPENIIAEKASRLSRLLDSASELKKKILEKIQPERQVENLQTQKEINEQYDKFNQDIEARNELLKGDTEMKKEFEKLQKQLRQTEVKQASLEDELEEAKNISGKVTSKPGIDMSDPGVILHTDKDIAKMKIIVPSATE